MVRVLPLLLLVACSGPPDLTGLAPPPPGGPGAALTPLGPLLAQADAVVPRVDARTGAAVLARADGLRGRIEASAPPDAALDGRAARLRDRAAALRTGPVAGDLAARAARVAPPGDEG
ncbi:MAG: hypothetical protein ACU0BF_09695 [Paracoccaceae bacterium]